MSKNLYTKFLQSYFGNVLFLISNTRFHQIFTIRSVIFSQSAQSWFSKNKRSSLSMPVPARTHALSPISSREAATTIASSLDPFKRSRYAILWGTLFTYNATDSSLIKVIPKVRLDSRKLIGVFGSHPWSFTFFTDKRVV